MRQRSSRYAIRAGRNLPDKEFRYLRMVIVTTAVYWGLSSQLRLAANPVPLTFQHRAGVSPYTSYCNFARTCVFGKQSLEPGLCGLPALRRKTPTRQRAPLLPKLRGHFAEFLIHDSLDRLGILYLTTCVGFGYGPLKISLDAFLDSIGSSTSPYGSASALRACETRICLRFAPTTLPRDNHRPGWTAFLCHTIAELLPHRFDRSISTDKSRSQLQSLSISGFVHGRFKAGTGISTSCPSTTPDGLALGPDLPWAD
jgi:hypothetical protein